AIAGILRVGSKTDILVINLHCRAANFPVRPVAVIRPVRAVRAAVAPSARAISTPVCPPTAGTPVTAYSHYRNDSVNLEFCLMQDHSIQEPKHTPLPVREGITRAAKT